MKSQFVKWGCGCTGISTEQGDFVLLGESDVDCERSLILEADHKPNDKSIQILTAEEINSQLAYFRRMIKAGEKFFKIQELLSGG